MSGNQVELKVRSQLETILSDFDNLKAKVTEVQSTLKSTGADVEKSYGQSVKRTETFLGKLRDLSSRVASQLKSDFKSLASLNAVQDSLKISNQFRGIISDSVSLNDTIRKLGATFGITKNNFASFQASMVRGLGEVGLSSDVAARSMEGLADTTVRGEQSVLGYSKTSGMLASISGKQGQEGAIAKGIAEVIQARGGNANDMDQLAKVAEDLRRVYTVTGKGPDETLRAMKDLFTAMPKEMRKSISTRGLANLAAAGQAAGPNATKFIEEFMSKSEIQRKALEAQGFKGVFTDQGIDVEKFNKAAKSVLSRIGGDPRMAAKTLGLTDEAADGFVRLSESMDKVKDVQDKIAKSTGNLSEQYAQSMGFAEAFRANINKMKSIFATPLSWGIDKASTLMGEASQSTAGAAAVTLGGGALAAILAGGGLRGLGKGMLGGMAKEQAIEAITGEEVQKVYVVNASEIGSSFGAADLMGKGIAGKAGGLLKSLGSFGLKGAAVAGAGYLGYKAGELINDKVVSKTGMTTSEGFEGNMIEALFFKLDKLFGGEASTSFMKNQQLMTQQKVIVESRTKDFTVSKPKRGTSY